MVLWQGLYRSDRWPGGEGVGIVYKMIENGQRTKEKHQNQNKLTLGSNIMVGSVITLKINEKKNI